MIRKDQNDKVFRTMKEKHDAIVADIKDCVKRGQPVLVGTTSIENSELLSDLLTAPGCPTTCSTPSSTPARPRSSPRPGGRASSPIATNMAGRGTDIVLGGNVEKPIALIRGTKILRMPRRKRRSRCAMEEVRHEQVRRRRPQDHRHRAPRVPPHRQPAARPFRPPGRPGAVPFYLSLEDPLMKIFAGERLNAIMVRLKMPEGEAIEAGMVTALLETAQRKVEQRNFDIRKQLLEYDDVPTTSAR